MLSSLTGGTASAALLAAGPAFLMAPFVLTTRRPWPIVTADLCSAAGGREQGTPLGPVEP